MSVSSRVKKLRDIGYVSVKPGIDIIETVGLLFTSLKKARSDPNIMKHLLFTERSQTIK